MFLEPLRSSPGKFLLFWWKDHTFSGLFTISCVISQMMESSSHLEFDLKPTRLAVVLIYHIGDVFQGQDLLASYGGVNRRVIAA